MAYSKHDINEIRKDNIRRVAETHGGSSAMAAKLGHANASFLVQMIGPNPTRSISEKTARQVEQVYGLAQYSIDQAGGVARAVVGDGAVLHADPLAAAIESVSESCKELSATLPTHKFSDVVAFVYRESTDHGRPIDRDFVKRLILLAR